LEKSILESDAPTEILRTVALRRRPNAELRTREHLTPSEVDALIEAAKANRYGHRDATMILIAFRHGLRAAEVCDLRWDQIDFSGAVLHVRRVKNGTPSAHPLLGDELRALRRLQRESPPSPFVFVSERGTPFTTAGFARMIERAARRGLGLELKATRTCFAMPAVMRSPTGGTIPGLSRDGWGTGRSRARRCIRLWRRTGSRISGESEQAVP
jgi:type 1 fimbriae regulatory protein FimB/type 1 fimbriae regulatory protein FimE